MPDLDFVGDLSAGGSTPSRDLPGALSPLAKISPVLQGPLKPRMDRRDLLLPCWGGSGAVDLGTSSRSWLLLCPQ